MHNIKSVSIISFCFFLLNTVFVSGYAEERVITLGGKAGWKDVSVMEKITTGDGKYGYPCMQLDTNSRSLTSETDLLLDFEDEVPVDRAGNYEVVSNNVIYSNDAKMGKGSGLVRGNGGLRLHGKQNSIFGTAGLTGSFLIEFWLNPSIAENGETVLSWRSSRTVHNSPLYQMINASFYKNHLEWMFTNVFNGYTENDGVISIASYSTIIPDVWTHHAISFDQDTGLLEYRINGKLEALKYITSTGKERGSVYQAILGVAADIDISPAYTGLIDDLRIQRSCHTETASEMRYDTFHRNGGRFETDPIMVSQEARLTKIDAVLSEPDQTSVVLYVRSGNNYFSWGENYPEWVPVTNHEEIKNQKGLYFQVAADLFPDGTGSVSPAVMQIDLHFKEEESPLPPFRVFADAGDGEVTLTWSYSLDSSTGGYYIYYGDRPGEYLGREAAEGESPVDVGNVNKIKFTGLKNGKIYYFSVAAYSKVNNKIMGVLSKEVYARPLKK
ncbi:MAG: hypothetical protein K6G00_00305 [Treponema sp.]|nr:hypothetical protein [Treponema sp.]